MDYGLGACPGTSDFVSLMLGGTCPPSKSQYGILIHPKNPCLATMPLMAKKRCIMEDHDAPFLGQRSGRVHKRHERWPCGILVVVSAAPKSVPVVTL
ncbi:hypothetical protein PISMIDRAFT_338984 [Pisolithus microcarpus 441]|uniref:Unplaced genomic scaffold scaffold_23, whole genome shotgun sequence n=1 Tax=Pisolithus microcarpus 441 TaxID=765257 RepID=A0A0C9ZHR9_9AGAM|nr:hypothetical protein PISMIDRAFT_338984 [Pisolithus microcarpus 441]